MTGGGGRLFDTHIVVDWSARSSPSPRRPAKDSIWWAAKRDGDALEPEYARTRHDAIERLADFIACELDARRRVLTGFDFPFGYPRGVARRLTGSDCALALWDWIDKRVKDGPDNRNNRYEVATEINERYLGVGPFWGRPERWDFPRIPIKGNDRTCPDSRPPERRIADLRATSAKTVWQLAYTGSVGSQVILGLPALKRLSSDPRIERHAAIWPFQTGLRPPDTVATPLVLAEIYPSLLKAEIARLRKEEIPDRAQVRVNAAAFAELDRRGGLAPLFEGARDLDREERDTIEREEAWILGLGHETALREACR